MSNVPDLPETPGVKDSRKCKEAFLDHVSQFKIALEGEMFYDLNEALDRYVDDFPHEAKKLLWYLVQSDPELGLGFADEDDEEDDEDSDTQNM